jgi:trans-2-enoyl-CoA reductase
MLDIVKIEDGKDLQIADSAVPKAANVIGTQLASLEYAPNLGVDLKYFLQSDFQIPVLSFKTYLVQRLLQHQVNVSQCVSQIEALFNQFTFFVDDANKDAKGLIV